LHQIDEDMRSSRTSSSPELSRSSGPRSPAAARLTTSGIETAFCRSSSITWTIEANWSPVMPFTGLARAALAAVFGALALEGSRGDR
jgi:hypothetical protein